MGGGGVKYREILAKITLTGSFEQSKCHLLYWDGDLKPAGSLTCLLHSATISLYEFKSFHLSFVASVCLSVHCM